MLVTVAVAGVWVLGRGLEPRGESWVRVERRDLVIDVDVEGELRAVESAQLGPPPLAEVWDFKISFMVPEGSEVREGEPVLGFDTTPLGQRLQERIAVRDLAAKRIEKKTSDLANERRDLELRLAEAQARLRQAAFEGAVPEEVETHNKLEKARIDHRLAETEIDFLSRALEHLDARGAAEMAALGQTHALRAQQVRDIEDSIERMTVQSPRAGTVLYLTNWRGEKKKTGDSTWRAERVMEIPDLSRMLAEGEVAEADAGRIADGQPVTFRLDAYPDEQYRGSVRAIRRTVERKSRRNPERVVRLEIELEGTDVERMRPGMRWRGRIETRRLADTLVVPGEAVFPRPGGAVVYARTLMGRREVRPRFGQRNAEFFEVLAGLDEGDRVLGRSRGEQGDEG
ncbi:MAG: HlyD family efflux transporter periplasmic adaptor subunit [bacterium]|nr:HlyD family efflux transporter periplasmic adaptor subunit [bacterium]